MGTNPEPAVKLDIIKCTCGNNVFLSGQVLSPGEKRPVRVQKVWVCVGCGATFLDNDFPKKGDNARRESKLILPENKKLLIQ